ncbi:polysaccharide deacetylase family protein [Aequorivita antarctica]|uniref:Polysaccharide deacetylase family protein n=1 Tax=Aequorivita antarctica TaxID=153266 RepID=A0A5C6Z6G1_9FLAO|nr:polysaccharide deacetylase family protein [Aequorivita antarctica]TXD75014.1 polysaccharide deacetylase family protein [Aequorivita antarctica]SRX72257.1 Peptidoglycan-N-acetylglucosamine deacetylase [Aequorivita antarctica]
MPRFIQRLYPERIWAFSRKSNAVYLTFDDGPIPEITPWVLDELKKYNAKATFFCIGENVKKHPEIYRRILSEGHSVGNHTFNHLKGTKTETSPYIKNVLLAEEIINSKLFRPPYGKITSKQSKILQKKGFKIVMWDIISYDYDATVSEEECLQNVLKYIKAGSVVVFHDSLKAEKNLRYVLPKVLNIFFSSCI